MVRLACIDLAGPVELFQQHHPKELVGKGGRPKGNALIRPAQNGVRKPQGPADEEGEAAFALVVPLLEPLGQLGGGEGLSLIHIPSPRD